MGSFSLDMVNFSQKAMHNVEQVISRVAIDLLSNIVLRSPVGNAELWAANAHAMYGRTSHNVFVDAINADLTANAANYSKSGKLKRGVKLAKTKSARSLAIAYPLQAGKGYVGGRFRANWQATLNVKAGGEIDGVDPSGSAAIGNGTARIESFDCLGNTVYLSNNLPYAQRLEDGWSTQAPSGMVGLAASEFQQYLNKAVNELP